MAKKRKFSSVDDKCRVCLGNDGCMSDIFSEELRPKIDNLGDSTSVHIDDDENLPRNICHVCLYKLDMWIEFRRQFLRSNAMLREHLGVGEPSENAISVTKRKHNELQGSLKDDSAEHGAAKKMKSDEITVMSTDRVGASCGTIEKSPVNCDPMSIDTNSFKNISDNVEPAEQNLGSENMVTETRAGSPIKQTFGRRSKTTERRKASTKRWVARKKALLAATGENDTDTDSISSDDAQLSPVQKARAKCNAEKVAETQRRISKTLKTYESNITDYYDNKRTCDDNLIEDTDTDSRKKSIETTKKDLATIDSRGDSHPSRRRRSSSGSGSSSSSNNNNVDGNDAISMETKKLIGPPVTLESLKDSSPGSFLPHSVRSELIIDDATFIVTSTLVLTQPHRLNPVAITSLSKEPFVSLSPDETNLERNTDIIDAVQLRRVCPKTTAQSDKKFVERCLNIEVEGTELEALQRVQSELANFVETKLFKDLEKQSRPKNDNNITGKNMFQSLEQQLKTIVEKSIKKNIETSKNDKLAIENRGNNTFDGEFVKAAMRSKIFQPRVLLVRYEACADEITRKIERENLSRAICKKTLISSCRPSETASIIPPSLGKRRSVKPAKYADYDGSTLNTTSEEPRDVAKKLDPASGPRSSKTKNYGSVLLKPENSSITTTTTTTTSEQRDLSKSLEIVKREAPGQSVLLPKVEKNVQSTAKSLAIGQNISAIVAPPPPPPLTNNFNVEKHICGVCGESFGTRREVEIHFSAHKTPVATIKQVKQKMMRCKRCHEIVEARCVKLHVCDSPKNLHKCYTCEAIFRSEKLLLKHLETHSLENEAKIVAIPPIEIKKEIDLAIVRPKECPKNSPVLANTKGNLSQAGAGGQTNETYTCFVCDKIFEGEEVLKDHLQKHCDDMSDEENVNEGEEEPSDDKELYQCAICGESMISEDALESHVEKHLFDDEDDNPNLISIGCGERERAKKSNDDIMIHGCGQCTEKFDSEMLLMLHMQAHEEEVAIAEWERRGVDNSQVEQHICVICDELFATEAELSEHLDVHNGNAHVCLLCDKPFLTLEELQSHVNTH